MNTSLRFVKTALTGVALLMSLSACPLDEDAEVGAVENDPDPNAAGSSGNAPQGGGNAGQAEQGGFEAGPNEGQAEQGGFEMAPGGAEVPMGGHEVVQGGAEVPQGGHEMVPGGAEVPQGGHEMIPGGAEVPMGGHEMVPAEDLDGDGAPADIDCNDRDPTISPFAPELCNMVDDNCNGEVDDNCGGGAGQACMADSDCPADPMCGPGLCINGACANGCNPPPMGEVCGDGLDNDGNGQVDENCGAFLDADADGATSGIDCNDADPTISPFAGEQCDMVDNDCNGIVDDNCVNGR
jgi:hypothetical protein